MQKQLATLLLLISACTLHIRANDTTLDINAALKAFLLDQRQQNKIDYKKQQQWLQQIKETGQCGFKLDQNSLSALATFDTLNTKKLSSIRPLSENELKKYVHAGDVVWTFINDFMNGDNYTTLCIKIMTGGFDLEL